MIGSFWQWQHLISIFVLGGGPIEMVLIHPCLGDNNTCLVTIWYPGNGGH